MERIKLKRLIEILDSLPEEVKDQKCWKFDFGMFTEEELLDFINRKGWENWGSNEDFSIIF